MSRCIHGNDAPEKCSQCLQAAGKLKVRVVRVAAGVSTFAGHANFGTIALPNNKAKRCIHCRKAGHTSEDCRDAANKKALHELNEYN